MKRKPCPQKQTRPAGGCRAGRIDRRQGIGGGGSADRGLNQRPPWPLQSISRGSQEKVHAGRIFCFQRDPGRPGMTENGGKSRLNKDLEPLHDKPVWCRRIPHYALRAPWPAMTGVNALMLFAGVCRETAKSRCAIGWRRRASCWPRPRAAAPTTGRLDRRRPGRRRTDRRRSCRFP